jgi:hypothetical protein
MEVAAFDDGQELGESMLEEIRRTAERRLHQIEPLLEEAERLRDVLEVLGARSTRGSELATGSHDDAARRVGEPAGPSRGSGGSTGSGTPERLDRARDGARSGARAAKGSNKRTILALVGDRPGITAAQISEMTGMKRTVVASTVSRLKRHGELLEHNGGGVCLPPAGPVPSSQTIAPAATAPQPRSRPGRQHARRLRQLQAQRAA